MPVMPGSNNSQFSKPPGSFLPADGGAQFSKPAKKRVVKKKVVVKKTKPLTAETIIYATLGTAGPDGIYVTPIRVIVDIGEALSKSLKIGGSFEYGGQLFVLTSVTKKDDANLSVVFRTKGTRVKFIYPLSQMGR